MLTSYFKIQIHYIMETLERSKFWFIVLVLSAAVFGVFVYLLLLSRSNNAAQNPEIAGDIDAANLTQDWQKVFGDVQVAFDKIKR